MQLPDNLQRYVNLMNDPLEKDHSRNNYYQILESIEKLIRIELERFRKEKNENSSSYRHTLGSKKR